MKKINVLILTHSLHIGGAENHVYNLITNINNTKYNFTVLCLFELGAVGKMISESGIKTYHNVMRNNLDLLGFRELIRIVRNEKIDILYIVLTPVTLFWGTFCKMFADVRAIITRSTTMQPNYRVPRRRKIITSLTLNFVDKVVAQSYSHRDYLINCSGFDAKKIFVIYNAVNMEKFKKGAEIVAAERLLNIPPGDFIVGMVARLEPEKRIMTFLRAARIVLDSIPRTHFFIAGDGKETNKLHEEARALKIETNVHFLGTRKDVPQLVSLMDIGVSSSVMETCSNTILEYMAASKPVVSTDAGSNAELVVDTVTGFVVPRENYEAMADALIRLLKDERLAKKMGEAGRRRAEEMFAIQRMINEYDELFTHIMT